MSTRVYCRQPSNLYLARNFAVQSLFALYLEQVSWFFDYVECKGPIQESANLEKMARNFLTAVLRNIVKRSSCTGDYLLLP